LKRSLRKRHKGSSRNKKLRRRQQIPREMLRSRVLRVPPKKAKKIRRQMIRKRTRVRSRTLATEATPTSTVGLKLWKRSLYLCGYQIMFPRNNSTFR
jgi:hypothetical protein